MIIFKLDGYRVNIQKINISLQLYTTKFDVCLYKLSAAEQVVSVFILIQRIDEHLLPIHQFSDQLTFSPRRC